MLKHPSLDFYSWDAEYLGHIVIKEGVKGTSNNIEVMVSWPRLKNIKVLRRLELSTYEKELLLMLFLGIQGNDH